MSTTLFKEDWTRTERHLAPFQRDLRQTGIIFFIFFHRHTPGLMSIRTTECEPVIYSHCQRHNSAKYFFFFFSFVVVPRMFEYYIDVYLRALFLEFTRVQAEVAVVGGVGGGLGFSTASFVSVVSHQRSDGNAENM